MNKKDRVRSESKVVGCSLTDKNSISDTFRHHFQTGNASERDSYPVRTKPLSFLLEARSWRVQLITHLHLAPKSEVREALHKHTHVPVCLYGVVISRRAKKMPQL